MQRTAIFFWTPDLSATVLRSLLESPDQIRILAVVTRPDAPVGRRQIMTPSPVRSVAESAGIPVFTPDRLRDNEELKAALMPLAPDYLITIAYGKILPDWILALPRRLPLNIHGSLLPKYRWASPVQSALLHGEEETGITIMEMVKEMDAGRMLLKESFPLTSADTTETVFAKMAQIAPWTLISAIDGYESGALTLTDQDPSGVSVCGMIEKSDARLDLSLSAQVLFRRYQAFTPWPGVYAMLGDKRLQMTFSHYALGESAGEIGSFVSADDGVALTLADGKILVTRVKVEGGSWISAGDFLRSRGEVRVS